MKFDIPQDLHNINKIFNSSGFVLYLVGGAVRSLLVGKNPVDWDLASNASPQDTMSLFKHVIPTGIKYGTVTIRFRKKNYEITTFRLDGKYSDARHPNRVSYANDIREDLSRRDFTINAMAYDFNKHQLLDPYGGRSDLQKQLIQTVGNPSERFSEDGLRIIRGLRLASQLGFTIAEESYTAMVTHKNCLQSISIERIREEFTKILLSPRPSLGIRLVADTGILHDFIPELDQCRKVVESGYSLFDILLASCNHAPQENLILRLASLFHNLVTEVGIDTDTQARTSAHMAVNICRRMKYSKIIESEIHFFVENQAYVTDHNMSDAMLRRLVSRIGSGKILDFLMLKKACIAGRKSLHGENQRGRCITLTPKWLNELEKRVNNMLHTPLPLTISDLAINGHELHIHVDIPKNRHMSDVLKALLELVLENPDMNQKDILIESAKAIYKELLS